MHLLSILGIIVVAVGTLMMVYGGSLLNERSKKIHLLTILGIIVIAVGTLMMVYGGVIQNRKDSIETTNIVTKKIESAMQLISEVEHKNPQDSARVENILDEFSDWADNFLANREAKTLEIKRARLSTLEKEIAYSAEATSFLANSFSIIEGLLEAYSRHSGQFISVHFPEKIPENVYRTDCMGYIDFPDSIRWEVSIHVNEVPDQPAFVITTGKLSDALLILAKEDDNIRIIVGGEGIRITNPRAMIELNDKKALRRLFEDIIENRIYDMELKKVE